MDLPALFRIDLGLLEIVFRTAIVYLAVMLGIRLLGKRQLGQLTIFDFVLILIVSNAVQNAMVGQDSSLTGGLVAAITLFLLNAAISRIRENSPLFRRLVEGSPTLLVVHGKVLTQNMAREGIDHEELAAAIREHGIEHIDDVELAVLEVDGTISVVQNEEQVKHGRRRVKVFKHGSG